MDRRTLSDATLAIFAGFCTREMWLPALIAFFITVAVRVAEEPKQ